MTCHAYHWTPDLQRRFIETLATTGSVKRACVAVGKTRAAAYNLRRRAGADRFRAAWDAAVLIASERIGNAILEFALDPIEYVGVRHAESQRLMWRRVEPMLGPGMGGALVRRLDRAAARVTGDTRRATDAEPFMCILARKSADLGGLLAVPPRGSVGAKHCPPLDVQATSPYGRARTSPPFGNRKISAWRTSR